MKHVRREFRQLADAGQRRGIHNKGRQNFRVAVPGVCLKEKRGQCPLHPCTKAAIDCEPRSSDLRGALEVQNSRSFRDFPMRPRRKIKFRRGTPSAHLDICAGVVAHRDGAVRAVGHGQHKIGEARIQLSGALTGSLDFAGDAFHFREQRRGILARPLATRDFLAGLVSLGFQALGRGDSLTALLIERTEAVEINGDAAIRRHLLKFIQVFAKIRQVMHAQRIP